MSDARSLRAFRYALRLVAVALWLAACSPWAAAQSTATLAGTVLDERTGETLPYANVLVVDAPAGVPTGATTNVDGYFALVGLPADTDSLRLRVSYLGYEALELVAAPGAARLRVGLRPAGRLLEEVTVTADVTAAQRVISASTGISESSLQPAQLDAIPSLGQRDLFRALQLLPGVSGSNEATSGLYVRGGTPDQNLVRFDGFTVYHVDHLFGLFSAFNPAAVKDVRLYKGGFGAEYGGRLSSVVDIVGKDGNTEAFDVGAGISLLSADAFAEVPFAGGRGTVLVAGRRSFDSGYYRDLLELSDGDADTGDGDDGQAPAGPGGRRGSAATQPASWFYDLNAKAVYRLGESDVLTASLYAGEDRLDNGRTLDASSFGGGQGGRGARLAERLAALNFSSEIADLSNWGNLGASLAWSRRLSDRLYVNTLLSASNYFSRRDRGSRTLVTRDTATVERVRSTLEDNDLTDLSLASDWELRATQDLELRFGAFASALDVAYDLTRDDTLAVLARDDDATVAGVYAAAEYTLADRLVITPGVRASYFSGTEGLYAEPRLQLRYLATERVKLKAAAGRYYQFVNRVVREDVAEGSRDFWTLSDGGRVPVGRADHLIAGASYETDAWLLDAEGYVKTLDGLTEYAQRLGLSGGRGERTVDFQESFFRGDGLARGVELLVQRKSGALTGWAGYTLGRVEHDFPDFGEEPFPALHDVTHEGKLVLTYRWRRWKFGSSFIYATGRPYTEPIGAYAVEVIDGAPVERFAIGAKNGARLPDYHRLDLSASNTFPLFGGEAEAGLSLFNLYNRTNVWYKEFDVVEGLVLETDVTLLGATPSIHFNWKLR